jgi:hypothetical protein
MQVFIQSFFFYCYVVDPRKEIIEENPIQVLIRIGTVCSSSESLSNVIRAILHYFLLAYGNYFSSSKVDLELNDFYSLPYYSLNEKSSINKLKKPILPFSNSTPPLPLQSRSKKLGLMEILPESLLLKKVLEILNYSRQDSELFEDNEYFDLQNSHYYARIAINSLFNKNKESNVGSFSQMFKKRKPIIYSSPPLNNFQFESKSPLADIFDLLQLCCYSIFNNVEALNSLALMAFLFGVIPADHFRSFINSERNIAFAKSKFVIF